MRSATFPERLGAPPNFVEWRSASEIAGTVATALAERDLEIRRLRAEVTRLEGELTQAQRRLPAVRPPASNCDKRAYTVAEATVALGLNKTAVYRLLAEGRLASTKIGRRRLILADGIDALLVGQPG